MNYIFLNLLVMQYTIILYEKVFDRAPCILTGFEHKHEFEQFHYGIHWNSLFITNKN